LARPAARPHASRGWQLPGRVGLALALSLVLLQMGWANTAELVIGMSAAFRGPSRGLGIELFRGSMSYLEHVNAAGGIHGRQIVVQTYDDSYQPIPAIENTITLIEKDNVLLLFDYVGTPTVTRILPLLKRYSPRSMYLFFPFTGAQPQREPPYDEFVFNLRASYREETAGLVDHFVRDNKPRIAVFYQADAYGRSGWDGVRKALSRHGLGMVGEATYRRGTLYNESFQQHVTILRQARPDAIISVGAYAACAALIREVREAGWEVPIANVSFVGSESLLKLLLDTGQATGKNYTTNLINSQVVPSYEDTSLPAVREYRELMDQYESRALPGVVLEGYVPLKYSFVGFEGFLNGKLLVEILRRLGETPDRARIKEVVEQIVDLDLGIETRVSFAPHRHQGLDRVYYTTVQDGRFVPMTQWERVQP
jgi:branched-chain amino acid transport system substrate-binding protein